MHPPSPSIDPSAVAHPWYRHLWPWLLMAGPAAVILAGSYLIWLSFSSQDAMVVDDYYKQGKAINQDLRRDRVATTLGLTFVAHYAPASGALTGTLLGFGKPVPGALIVRLAHATQPEKDLQLLAQPDAQGDFTVSLPMLERGRWQVVIESAQREWRLNGVWKWPQQQSIAITADAAPVN